ncbi:MAG: hypothetical protein AAGF11_33195 [Myxococcota bacterium]
MTLGAGALTSCTDSPVPSQPDGTTTGSPSTGTGTGTACMPGEMEPCTCLDGNDGNRICGPDELFGACECEGDTIESGMDTSGGTDDSTSSGDDDSTSTTGPQPCTEDADCADAVTGDCEIGICGPDGICGAEPAPFDTPCGSAVDDECTAPDTCNNNAECVPNNVDDGLVCTTCVSGQCTCTAGACGECNVFAPTNNFITTRSIEGWDLTGSWGLYRQTPSTQLAGASEFPGQVLGSNGNRVAPFPGAEVETSYARTRPSPLPDTIIFLSWNVDEGGGVSDNKTVRVSVDGGATWDTLADCAVDPSWAFCTPNMEQDPAVFNLVQIPVPPAMAGMEGIVEFGYDTGDECCDFEKGWYIDSLNMATECLCQQDSDCAGYTDECGAGVCSIAGECALMPMPADTACGDAFDNDCNGADTCDGVGYCRSNEQPNGLALCGDCPGGGPCSFCEAGQCLDCMSFSDFGDFNDPGSVAEWVVTDVSGGGADWRIYNEAPANTTSGPIPFPNAPVYGTDGNRQEPYPGAEAETSNVVTGEGTVPMAFTFISWNVDEGGSFYDNKIIELTVDGGVTWNTLVNCEMGIDAIQPFCTNVGDGRLGTDWDMISIDTAMWEGMTGQIRFTYDTQDSCCSFERGWFIDDLNAFSISCNDVPFQP